MTRERLDLQKGKIDYQAESVREPLIEHIGQLPIIATFLWPKIENRSEVDLGSALIMLATHDIGELDFEDIPRYFKDKKAQVEEHEYTLQLLDADYRDLVDDMEYKKTMTGKFAKCVDWMSPFLNDLLLPVEHTRGRLENRKFDIEKVYEMEKEDFAWDGFLIELFEVIFEEYRLRINGDTGLELTI